MHACRSTLEDPILFIGDSITAGYGVLGAGPHCGFSSSEEDFLSTYAWRTSGQLNADAVAIAYSGKGVYRNIDPSDDETIIQMWHRTLPDETTSTANPAALKPQVVVFSLGTNDFVAGVPGKTEFQTAYLSLLTEVRQVYGSAHFVLALSPMLNDWYPEGEQQRTKAAAYLSEIVAARVAAGDTNVSLLEFDEDTEDGLGCDWHPGQIHQQGMGTKLTAHLRAKLGW